VGTIKIDPVNRIEGHQQWVVDYSYDAPSLCNKVNSGKVKGMMFRGFELILKKRDPRDAIIICGRI
jgi:Ni,Fe-hydrogenase I large subunit